MTWSESSSRENLVLWSDTLHWVTLSAIIGKGHDFDRGALHTSSFITLHSIRQKRIGRNSLCKSLNLLKSVAKLRRRNRISPCTFFKYSRFLYQLLMLLITICMCCIVQILYLWGWNTFLSNWPLEITIYIISSPVFCYTIQKLIGRFIPYYQDSSFLFNLPEENAEGFILSHLAELLSIASVATCQRYCDGFVFLGVLHYSRNRD